MRTRHFCFAMGQLVPLGPPHELAKFEEDRFLALASVVVHKRCDLCSCTGRRRRRAAGCLAYDS